ncbi:hypothetical protein V1520DRAFT_358303 [Lipomyces starkeyi]|uniref:Uncharacterized protein n=1 Tax=Lipomyces starkeyi NRRL Y-11557 TaxID=675824 RepID=A0A1E3Q726_LIPST|nr:hypothetical protein LIPSTDRAFT_63567 [Lipomyces starkeyi NRRL Y-11557]
MYAYLLPLLLCFVLISYYFLRRISDTVINKPFASTPSTTSSTPSEQPASSSGDSAIDQNSYIRQSRHLDAPQSRRIRVTFQPDGEGASEIYEIILPELNSAATPSTIRLAGESFAAPPPAASPPDPSVLLRPEQEHLRNPIHRHIFQADDEINDVQQHKQDAIPKSPLPWTLPSVDPPQPTAGRRLRRQSPAVSPRVETATPAMPRTPRRTQQSAHAGDDNVRLPPQGANPTMAQSDYEHIRQNRPSSPAGEFSNRLRDGMGGMGMGSTGNIPLGTTGYEPPRAMPIPQATVMPTMMPGYLPNHIPAHLTTQSMMPPVQQHLQPLPTQPMGNAGWVFPGAYPNPYVTPTQHPHMLGPGSGVYLMSTPPQPIPPGQHQAPLPIPATVPSPQAQQGQPQCPYCEHEHHHHHRHYRSPSPSRSRSRSSDRVVVVSGAPGGGGGGGGGVGGSGHMGGFGGIWDPLTMYKEQELEKQTLTEAYKSEKKKLEDEVKNLKIKAEEKNKVISIRNEDLKKIWELPLSKVRTWHSLQQKMIEAFPSSAEPLLREGYYEVRRLEDNVHILPTLWPEVMKESKEYEIILIPPPVPAAPSKKSNGLANLKNGSFQKWYAEVDKKGRQRKIIG